MPRKIVLIDPIESKADKDIVVRNEADFSTGSPVVIREPIAIEYIGGYIRQYGYHPIIIGQGNKTNEELAIFVAEQDPFAIGVGVHSTYLFNHSIDLAQRIRQRIPKTRIVFGGYHPSGDVELVRNECVDFVVFGEGEETFRDLLDHLYAARDVSDVEGIAYKDSEGNVRCNLSRERMDFSRLPWPMRDPETLKESKCAPLCLPSPPKQKAAAQISYSRGCPHQCDFCASPLIWGSRISYRNPKDVVAEIDYLQREFGTNFLFFNDLSFNASKRRVRELSEEIRKSDLDINWFAYATTYGMDYETANLMAQAGCTRLGFGVESVLDDTLGRVKPRQRYQQIKEVLEMTSGLGLLNRCYFMIGWPWESRETIRMTQEFMQELPMDQIRMAFVVPFPGTQMYKAYRNRIARGFDDFTGDLPVFPSDSLTLEELEDASRDLFAAYYNSPHYRSFVESKVKRFPHLKDSFDYFFDYLQRHNILR